LADTATLILLLLVLIMNF